MALVGLQEVSISFGGPRLLDGVTLQIERGERIALVGRNGEGKSTLLRILAGEEKPDHGNVAVQTGVRVGALPQSVPRELPGSVQAIVHGEADGHEPEWELAERAERAVARLGLDPEASFNSLSGGQKRRALLARALVHQPDVLLLDEPTNHLDLESIDWLEQFLLRYPGALLFVTHDRAFLRRLATRIVELDRGRLTSWAHGYDRYLQLRQELREAEEKQNALFDKKLAQEETWIRQGVKARRTRNEGRVRALMELRRLRSLRRLEPGQVTMQIQSADLSGRKAIAVEGLGYAWSGAPVVANFSTTIMRGDKIGIIGPNGCGKTTLLKLLLGQLAPQAGRVEHGTNLEIAYFDQHREVLYEDRSVAENVAGENDYVLIDGRRRHVIGYLEDFLFPPERSRARVRVLSGGERNRLLLARLFTRPSNLLVLDEPTNDLDAETLELLEDLLVEYPGTVLLVSHDREFLNDVVSETLVFEGEGRVTEYVGGYDDWVRQRPAPPPVERAAAPEPPPAPKRARKISFKQRKELEEMPGRIVALETELAELQQQMSAPEFFKSPPEEVRRVADRAAQIPPELEAAFALWQELDQIQADAKAATGADSRRA
jgi:ABC transport system ATP-binding/permease protein